MALDLRQVFISVQCLEYELMDFYQYICIDIDKIYVGIVSRQFSQIYNTVMALDRCQKFVSPHYIAKKLMYVDQFCIYIDIVITELWPLIDVRISFPLHQVSFVLVLLLYLVRNRCL